MISRFGVFFRPIQPAVRLCGAKQIGMNPVISAQTRTNQHIAPSAFCLTYGCLSNRKHIINRIGEQINGHTTVKAKRPTPPLRQVCEQEDLTSKTIPLNFLKGIFTFNRIQIRATMSTLHVFLRAQMSKVRQLTFLVTATVLTFGAQTAAAYDFHVTAGNGWYEFHYVHITTVSRLCHDRTPLNINRGDKPSSYATGTTAPGCLINGVQVSVAGEPLLTWSGIGSPGGTWPVMKYELGYGGWGPAYLCLLRPTFDNSQPRTCEK